MAKPTGEAERVLVRNKNIFDSVLLTETLKSELMEKSVFTDNTIEELFMVSADVTALSHCIVQNYPHYDSMLNC